MYYGSIMEVLWDCLLPPHALKQLCQLFCHSSSTSFIDFSRNWICTFNRRHMLNCFLVSVTVGNSSSRTLPSICGSLLIAFSLTDDGRLSTLLKYSAHLFKIASLSVKSVLPSALNCFQCTMELLHILPVCKRLVCFCFLDQLEVLHVREPV